MRPEDLEIGVDLGHVVERQILSRFIPEKGVQLFIRHLGKGLLFYDHPVPGDRSGNFLSLAAGLFEERSDGRGQGFRLRDSAVDDNALGEGNL